MKTTKRFEILGINDDESTCQCCGKDKLKCVVWIKDTETGEVKHFGTTCALAPVKGFDIPEDDMKRCVKSWKGFQQHIWSMARKAYKAAGGTWNLPKPYEAEVADRPLYEGILARITKEQRATEFWVLSLGPVR